MSGIVAVGVTPGVNLIFGRQQRRDQRVREASQAKRALVLDAIAHHPDATDGLRRQAEFYRRRLEAGMEQPHDT